MGGAIVARPFPGATGGLSYIEDPPDDGYTSRNDTAERPEKLAAASDKHNAHRR